MKTTLVILAAGLGSRYGGGGQKQVEKVGLNDEIIAHFSVFDAKTAGFDKVVFIIKREMEEYFAANITNCLTGIEIAFVYQETGDLPQGYICPPERTKPWGTGHALLAARDVVKEPFMVINADDFYGKSAYKDVHDFIINPTNGNYDFIMPGFILANTVPEQGEVTRGICAVENGRLADIIETAKIRRTADGFAGEFGALPSDSLASMNAWGFKPSIFKELMREFAVFLDDGINDLKSEFYLPAAVQTLIKQGTCDVHVTPARDKWFGITNPEDADKVRAAIKDMVADGRYPERLF